MDLFRNILYYTFVAPVKIVASVFTVWIPKTPQLKITANEHKLDIESFDIETPRKKRSSDDAPKNSPYKVTSPFKTVQDLALQLITKEAVHHTTSSSSLFSQRGDSYNSSKPRCTPRQESSRTRNVYIETPRSDLGVHNIATPIVTGDENLIQCNHLYFATSVQRGAGAFVVLPVTDCRKYDINEPIIDGHTAPVTDFAFNPFNHSLVASASEDCTVRLWNIPVEGIKSNITTPTMTLNGGHYRKITLIKFHPSVSTLLASVSIDGSSKLWDVECGKTILHTVDKAYDTSYHDLVWNNIGSSYVVSSKDQRIHFVDARRGIISSTIVNAHDGCKCIKLISLDDDDADRILSVGNTKGSMRQVKIWDPRNTSTEVVKLDIDNSVGTIMPFYDSYSSLLYLAGKGDGNVRMYEVNNYNITQLSEFKSNVATKGMTFLPKRACDVMKCEIGRMLKLSATGSVQPLSVYIPRQSTTFQYDLYPDIYSDIAPHTRDEWLNGSSNSMPTKVSMKPPPPVVPLLSHMTSSSALNTPRYNSEGGSNGDADDTDMITIQTPRMMSASFIEFLKRPSHSTIAINNNKSKTIKPTKSKISSRNNDSNNNNDNATMIDNKENANNDDTLNFENDDDDEEEEEECVEVLRKQLSSDLRKAKLRIFELENKCRRAGIALK